MCVLYENETVMIAIIKKCEWASECVRCNNGRMHVIWLNAPEWGKQKTNKTKQQQKEKEKKEKEKC